LDNRNINNDIPSEPGQFNPDPIIQAKDESGQNQVPQPAEVRLSVRKPSVLADSAFVINQPATVQRTEQSVSDIIKSILHFKWTIVGIFILVAAPLTAAIWTQVIPEYRARAEVRVRPITPFLVYKTEDSGMIPLYNSFMNTQVAIMRSLKVLQRVVEKREIQVTHWYKAPKKTLLSQVFTDKRSPVERLRSDLSVSPRSQTEILDVSFTTVGASDARLIVDTILDQYIKYTGEMTNASENELYNELVTQYNTLYSDIQSREKIVADISKTIGTGYPQELVASKKLHLEQTQNRLNELQQQITMLEWKQKQLNERFGGADGNGVKDANNPIQPQYSEDQDWRQLDKNVKTIQHKIESSPYTEKHPDIIQAKQDLEFAKQLLRDRQTQLDEQWLKKSLNLNGTGGESYGGEPVSLGYLLSQAKFQQEQLTEELKKERDEYDELFKNAQNLEKANLDLQHKKEIFDAVRQRKEQKDMERNVPGTIEILMSAMVPAQPDSDRRVVFTIMVMAMGISLGIAVAFLQASRNQVVYTAQDVPRPMQLPLLGYIPLVNLTKPIGKALSDELKQKQFILNESIRVMRTALLSRLEGQESASILITSSISGTGKSSFANTLGRSMAQAGKHVLVIDADIHKRALSGSYDLQDKPGFLDYLNAKSIEIPFIYPTDVPGLSIMPAGERNSNRIAFDEIANGSFQKGISQLRKRYQIILLDGPPLMPIADAAILSRQVDGAILVERERHSHRRDIISAISRLNSAGGRLFGFAFVGSMEYQTGGYNGYYYKSNDQS
jgi:capsular exopolysaccharide synthesis family protein